MRWDLERGSITWQFTPFGAPEQATGLLTLGWHLPLLDQPGTWCGEMTWPVCAGVLRDGEMAALPTAVQWVLEALLEDLRHPEDAAEDEEADDV